MRVIFASGAEREFDVVAGDDGRHSPVRELTFGPEDQFTHFLRYKAAAFETSGYRPRDERMGMPGHPGCAGLNGKVVEWMEHVTDE